MLTVKMNRQTLCEFVDYLSEKAEEDGAKLKSSYYTDVEKAHATKNKEQAVKFIKLLITDDDEDE